jgi:hypothetical protein
MAITFDTTSQSAAAFTTSASWLHIPIGTPKGILVLIDQNGSAVDQVTSVTYGGVNMIEVTNSSYAIGTPTGNISVFFLGSGVPTGNQTVQVNAPGGANAKRAVAISVAAAGDTEIEDSQVTQGTGANTSINLTVAIEAFCVGVMHIGRAAVTDSTAGANCTDILEHDFGSQICCFTRATNIVSGPTTFALNWTHISSARGVFAVAIKEAASWIPYTIWM